MSESTSDQKTFTVGFDAEFPPYGYRDESGEYVGFDLDLAEEVCDRQGWELVKQPIDWDSKDMELSTGAIDCIWNGFTIAVRMITHGLIHILITVRYLLLQQIQELKINQI